jgi:hypothetical protein
VIRIKTCSHLLKKGTDSADCIVLVLGSSQDSAMLSWYFWEIF